MKKFHILICIVVSLSLVFAAAMWFYHDETVATISNAGGAAGEALVGVGTSINGWLDGFEPYLVAVGGWVTGILFTYVAWNILRPKLATKISQMRGQSKPTAPLMGEPEYTPPQPIPAATKKPVVQPVEVIEEETV